MIKLPDLVLFSDYDGDWEKYLTILYRYFSIDFLTTTPIYKGSKLALKKYPKLKNKEATFWHIISEGDEETNKTPDIRRCERIRWPKVIIENHSDNSIKIWENARGSENNICLCYGNWEYLVVLRKREGYILFWTAYPIKYPHTQRKLQKEYESSL